MTKISNIPPADTQEAYERIRTYFSRPDAALAKAPTEGYGQARCSYRTENGDACAIGCLIPDELYQQNFEGNTFHFLRYEQLTVGEFFDNVQSAFLSSAQAEHDVPSTTTPAQFITKLDDLARYHKLEVPKES